MSNQLPNATASRAGRLLYIEDNPVNILVVEELVKSRPALTLVCEIDGTSGLARARSMRPDLILLDMQLPDFDGYEVLARLRADPDAGVAANAMQEDKRRAEAAGFLAYWTKPIDFKVFLRGLHEFFEALPRS
ncbi:MAG: response regulator [Paucibacter sp.]|nr:response regulator [Roseateles sp.]